MFSTSLSREIRLTRTVMQARASTATPSQTALRCSVTIWAINSLGRTALTKRSPRSDAMAATGLADYWTNWGDGKSCRKALGDRAVARHYHPAKAKTETRMFRLQWFGARLFDLG